MIWDFDTGGRADGGLRQVYAEDGQLVIELYGKDRVVSGLESPARDANPTMPVYD